MNILLDIDGVLADFVGAAGTVHGRKDLNGEYRDIVRRKSIEHPYRIWELLDMTQGDFWQGIAQIGSEFWKLLPRYDWASELHDSLAQLCTEKGTQLTLITSPTRQPSCLKGKLEWIQKYEGLFYDNYIISPASNRHLFARSDVILIDDNDENIKAFRKAGGYAILFPQPWNSSSFNSATFDRVKYIVGMASILIKEGL